MYYKSSSPYGQPTFPAQQQFVAGNPYPARTTPLTPPEMFTTSSTTQHALSFDTIDDYLKNPWVIAAGVVAIIVIIYLIYYYSSKKKQSVY
jgi:hypothetical protein